MVTKEDQLIQYRAKRQPSIDRIRAIRDAAEAAIPNVALHTALKMRYSFLESTFKTFESMQTKLIGHETPSTARLPKIPLPKFSGELGTWSNFVDLFTSLVDENDHLSGIEKFQYLISCLSNEPLTIVKAISLSNDNYQIAFDNLKKRYNNKRLLATSFWSTMTKIHKLENEDVVALRHLVNTFSENLSALDSLSFPVDEWDFPLFNILIEKIDSKTRTRFELEFSDKELPSYHDLHTFLTHHCRALETMTATSATSSIKPHGSKQHARTSLVVSSNTNSKSKCPICHDSHYIGQCEAFRRKSPHDRYLEAKKYNLCLNCLNGSHDVKSCQNSHRCRSCQGKHHTLLHFAPTAPLTSKAETQSASSQQIENPAQTLLAHTNLSSTILLSTIEVKISDISGRPQSFKALLDSGSQASFMTEKCCRKLGYRYTPIDNSVHALGGNSMIHPKGQTACTIQPWYTDTPRLDVDIYVLPTICNNMPNFSFSESQWPHLTTLRLADPHFYESRPIDMLLSADVFAKIILPGKIEGGANDPIALNTSFGWILSGRIQCQSLLATRINSFVASLSITDSFEQSLDRSLRRFWELEEVPRQTINSSEDVQCAKHFENTVSRDSLGRYIVELPFIEGTSPCLGHSRGMALRRLHSLEKRLAEQESLRDKYMEFMQDYVDSGHMTLASPLIDLVHGYFIPHHAVFKSDPSSSKLRVVFDVSVKSSDGRSLDNALLNGPKLQADIRVLLLRFRSYPIVLTSDVRQMYRQIWLSPSHRNYQRILWRFDDHEPVNEYVLNTVTYGISSAPYLALRTIQKLCEDEGSSFPLASSILRRDVYVDDIITGCDDEIKASAIIQELNQLLNRGGFELRKWASNRQHLLQDIPESCQQLPLNFDDDSIIKILGLRWNPSKDTFSYDVKSLSAECTKRSILSDLSRIFDPLGFLSPLTFFAKRLMQYLWLARMDWDQEPPAEVISKWMLFKSELFQISALEIPRYLDVSDVSRCEMHGFCDASEVGYGAVVYLRVITKSHQVKIHHLSAKSKVAPLKRVSIPRLELCSAVLLANLLHYLSQSYEGFITIDQIAAWSDSTVALYWIKSSPHRWKTFVGNRITQIQEKTNSRDWHHVPGKENPADIASRGSLPSELLNNSLWWAGPDWLSHSSLLPTDIDSAVELGQDVVCEERKIVLTTTIDTSDIHPILSLLSRFSNLLFIQKIVSYCIRFLSASQRAINRPWSSRLRHFESNDSTISSLELDYSLLLICRLVQRESFATEIDLLKRNKCCSKPIQRLSPFIDPDGILRVGGRLIHSKLSYDMKFPILLPGRHHFVDLLVESFHKRYLHVGLKTLQFLLVQQFWILSPKRAIRRVLSHCHRCFRVNPKSYPPIMGNLPELRISQIKPFSCVGVDFAGPFKITLGKSRGIKSQHKAYLCIFVCFATKAVHLELASDLSTDCFLAAFRRFIGRRGRCARIFSDCGTNFIGANKYLVEIMMLAVDTEKIEWSFNPPSAPHFGGLWESGVKSVKYHLMRVVGDQILTFEELYSALVNIEAILNSRPLTEISSDPHDLSVLTPGHFLTLEPMTALPDPDISNITLNRLTRWQLIQRIQQDFWKRWHAEYLHTLMQRTKWTQAPPVPVKLDSLVLIKEENAPPLRWSLGRIVKLHLGQDGVCRVATVRTSNGIVKRPIVKLCPLPTAQA